MYALNVWRDPSVPGTKGFLPPQARFLEPSEPSRRYRKPVCVLQGPYCVSSTEGFLLMARALDNVTTVGLPSRGASANPAPFELLPGVRVWLSRWRSLTPEGDDIEGVGVLPQVPVDGPPDAHRLGDRTLETALELLRR